MTKGSQHADCPSPFDTYFYTLTTTHTYYAYSTMNTNHATASFYSRSAISMEISVFDPELQRLIDELDHLNNSIPVDSLLGGAQQQDAKFDPFMSAMDDESYLSLYDLCGGNPILVDTIKWANSGPSIGSSITPLAAAAPSLQNDDFDFPAPRVGGKWVPALHSSLVPISWYYAPTPLAVAAQLTVPTPRPATPDPAPASSRGGPSRSVRNATNTRHQPYRKAALAKRDASGSTKGKRMRRAGRIETRDYLCAHPAKAEGITRLQGCRGLIREGRWGPIIVDTLRQIGVPYPTKGLQRVLAELYDGEGEQEGIPKEVKDRPAYPWRGSLSWHMCVKKKGYRALSNGASFVKLENAIYPSCYWWIAGTPIPTHCEGFSNELHQDANDETPPVSQ